MRMFHKMTAGMLAATIAVSPVLAAPSAIRPSMTSVSPATFQGQQLRTGTRLGSRVAQSNDLFGAPLFLLFLGAVTITIGTIVIINNNNDPSTSPG